MDNPPTHKEKFKTLRTKRYRCSDEKKPTKLPAQLIDKNPHQSPLTKNFRTMGINKRLKVFKEKKSRLSSKDEVAEWLSQQHCRMTTMELMPLKYDK